MKFSFRLDVEIFPEPEDGTQVQFIENGICDWVEGDGALSEMTTTRAVYSVTNWQCNTQQPLTLRWEDGKAFIGGYLFGEIGYSGMIPVARCGQKPVTECPSIVDAKATVETWATKFINKLMGKEGE